MIISPKSILRRTVVLGGLVSFIVFIMYLSSSSMKDKKKDKRWIVNSPLLSQQDINWSSDEDIQNNFPAELQQINSENNFCTNLKEEGGISTPKRILIWNSYWQSKALWNKIFAELLSYKCAHRCELSIDHADLEKSDAVLFHLVDLPIENYTFPSKRNPDQIWIGMTYEPPFILQFVGVDFQRLNGVFNRTMSYRTDGDIVIRHGRVIPISENTQSASTSNWVNSHDSTTTRNYASSKRRLVAWFASSRNCQSASGRELYIKELANYVEVDIYGSCGPYSCGKQKTMRNPYRVEEDDCYMLISLGYKFVLAFENSLCEDYVTEKLYNHLKLNVVPIVFGASNYSLFAPPNSVIDASQFTPEELATYIQLLDKNDTLYNMYFAWKKDYGIEAHDGVPLACDLCEQLYNPNWEVERKVYDQFDKWILNGCRKGYGEQ